MMGVAQDVSFLPLDQGSPVAPEPTPPLAPLAWPSLGEVLVLETPPPGF